MSDDLIPFYEMKSGTVYEAFKGGEKLPKKFYKKGKVLYNDQGGSEEGKYVGCSWVPPGAKYRFRAVPKEQPKKVEKIEQPKHDTISSLKPGFVYNWENGYLSTVNLVTLHNNRLYFVDRSSGKRAGLVMQDRVLTSDRFKVVSLLAPPPAPEEQEEHSEEGQFAKALRMHRLKEHV